MKYLKDNCNVIVDFKEKGNETLEVETAKLASNYQLAWKHYGLLNYDKKLKKWVIWPDSDLVDWMPTEYEGVKGVGYGLFPSLKKSEDILADDLMTVLERKQRLDEAE